MKILCETLLESWCQAMLNLQIQNSDDPRQEGAFRCPSCGKIHGRCFEAMYPFLYMAEKSGDPKWIRAAEQLFSWAETNVSQEDGSYINDCDCEWIGTTVFNTIQLTDCLQHHGALLSEETRKNWTQRLQKAAGFIYTCEEINNNNINYPISNALALYQCGQLLGNTDYIEKARCLAALANDVITEHGLIFGEGYPRFQKSSRGCYAIDIGYNVEETLPSLALYGKLSGDLSATESAQKSLISHLDFMLDNGAWDNSFGTRNFKWTYWGSRTSDGCALGYLLFADKHPEFALAAKKNIELMKACTVDGLLAGGPHYKAAGQLPCVHHTFTHAKVLASILDRKLYPDTVPELTLPRQAIEGIRHYAEIDSWLLGQGDMTATVTAYDWEYLPGGHVSGGTISLLHHRQAGTLLCAGMSQYSLYEPHNMQSPVEVIHECLALRIEKQIDSILYSSVYDTGVQVEVEGSHIKVQGQLKDISGQTAADTGLPYSFVYELTGKDLKIHSEFADGVLICPMISKSDETIDTMENAKGIVIHKDMAEVILKSTEDICLPYQEERIFNLVPGLQALRVDMKGKEGAVNFTIAVI